MPQAPALSDVEILDPLWIPMPDGVRLAARAWLPKGARENPVPAILEYLPYRRRDGTAQRDDANHPWFAANGYACIRVDIRGNGDSDGFMDDEYTEEELEDGVEVINWLARQPWCDGNVGMIGISWGGFNGLQIAAMRPKALKAIVTICSSDDRYADDIHYMGGCLLTENLGWSSQMLAYSSRAPDPQVVGERWREMWLERLERQPLLLEPWLKHQRRDAYWKRASVCEDYGAITAAVYAVGGWADAYTNTIPRLLENLKGPRKGLIGPWVHKYPHQAYPEPAIGFLQECKRWWDRWLKGEENGVDDEPILDYYIMDGIAPSRRIDARPGTWAAEAAWPSPLVRRERMSLSDSGLGDTIGNHVLHLKANQRVGAAAQRFCPGMRDRNELAADQRPDDAGSLVLDADVLERPLDIVGAAKLKVRAVPDAATGFLAARLCDVRPDGSVAFITAGTLNLTHSPDHAEVAPLEPGQPVERTLVFNDIAYRLPAGHRLRLALSTSYWPMVWPSAEPLSLEIDPAGSELDIPVRHGEGPAPTEFGRPEAAPPLDDVELRPESSARREETLEDGTEVLTLVTDGGKQRLAASGIESGRTTREVWSLHPDDPLSARMEASWSYEVGRGDWHTRTETSTVMTCDVDNFYIRASLEAFEGEKLIFDKTWDIAIPRDGV
ncbi:CocE/NonD family hydrolase [Stappia sp. GBMRC 2046]|uniref:CocE/NonD family hydrolase n=1 Tax=Stappia sediminis TaxID=2692190 RepID=A0A7X3LWE7_9HYPH|nr:CocE/NonD family hydrolase [Stappia sediminis]MXN66365.1 CocE/NonD family hydrolase [Stappia sediminis]